ncbi:hypothetical protein NEOKW01_0691 [Nematocida sp. AWRm80]|nr:hypothetical protein NEOKW01_0691 [Nematocida sp. AWRm80]
MGVKGLWKLLNGRELKENELNNKRVCVDGNIMLFSCLWHTNPRYITEYTLNKTAILLGYKVDPIIVFDGKRPMYKRDNNIRNNTIDTIDNQDTIDKVDIVNRLDIDNSIYNSYTKALEEQKKEYTQMTMDSFSEMQMNKIVARHKYIKSLTIQRMHGETDRLFKLKIQQTEEDTTKETESKEEQKEESRSEYKETEETITRLTDTFFTETVPQKEVICSRDLLETRNKSEPNQPVDNRTEVIEVIEEERKELEGIEESSTKLVEAEYQREVELYGHTPIDSYLSSYSPPKEPLSVALKVITDIFDLLQIKYVIGTGESDAIYRTIEKAVKIDGIITDDSDIFLFSSLPLYRHLFKTSTRTLIYSREQPEKYSWSELVLLTWILGSDYSPGIKGLGISKATQILANYKTRNTIEASDTFNIPLIKEILLEIGIIVSDRTIRHLEKLIKIYSEIEHRVKIHNLSIHRPTDKTELKHYLSRRTTWPNNQIDHFTEILISYQLYLLNTNPQIPKSIGVSIDEIEY